MEWYLLTKENISDQVFQLSQFAFFSFLFSCYFFYFLFIFLVFLFSFFWSHFFRNYFQLSYFSFLIISSEYFLSNISFFFSSLSLPITFFKIFVSILPLDHQFFSSYFTPKCLWLVVTCQNSFQQTKWNYSTAITHIGYCFKSVCHCPLLVFIVLVI